MKINFYTTRVVPFRGITDRINALTQNIRNGGGIMSGDSFTPSLEKDQTIIIEHVENMYGNGAQSNPQNANTGNAAVEGVTSGVAMGTGIEGAKSTVNKFKGNKDASKTTENTEQTKDEIDMTDENQNIEASEEINNSETDEFDADIDNEVDSDIEPDIEIEPEIEPDIEIESEIEFEPEIEIEPEIEPDIDIDISDIL